MRIAAIIPARLGAERLPNKPLALLGGQPLIQRTYDAVAHLFDEVLVATDATEIAAVCGSLNIPCVMTKTHPNGTSRCAEAAQHLQETPDYIINIQGDEPFLTNAHIQPLIALLNTAKPEAATVAAPALNTSDSNVYVAMDGAQRALYFSRLPIPAERDANGQAKRFQHLGIYAFTPEALNTYIALAPTELEQWEKLEQLRWMYHGHQWYVAIAPDKPLSIDTPEDLKEAGELFPK